jgi:hypothetical protein
MTLTPSTFVTFRHLSSFFQINIFTFSHAPFCQTDLKKWHCFRAVNVLLSQFDSDFIQISSRKKID